MKKELPHEFFDESVYQWSLKMEIGKIYTFEKIKMDKEKFINCISYLIACGECLKFSNDMKKLVRFSNLSQKEYFNTELLKDNRPLTSISPRRETFFTDRIKYTYRKNKAVTEPKNNPNNKFNNKLI